MEHCSLTRLLGARIRANAYSAMSAAFHRQAATRRSRIPLPLLTAHSSARYVAVSLYAHSCAASISPLRPHAPCIRRRLRLLITLLCLLLSTIKTIIYSLLMLIFSYFLLYLRHFLYVLPLFSQCAIAYLCRCFT